ncbi:MAG: ketoacyl-ACP synthase III [Oscillospiraceae bacterium]|nr:ketoacyl-ACP synthase III [Oscillospiraceae bacterium]
MIQNRGVRIIGTGSYKPDFVVKNSDFSEFLETDDAWITSRTGISERRFNMDGSNLSMAAKASRGALDSSEINAEEIDLIIASTATPDFFYPSLSCLVQNAIGAKNASAIDINVACTGFVNCFDVAWNHLAAGSCKKVLVVAAEMLSRHVDFTDRASCVLFGDGAGAVIVELAEDKLYASHLGVMGEGFDNPALYCKVGYNRNLPFATEENGRTLYEVPHKEYLHMDGKEVYKFAADIMPKAVNMVCGKAGLGLSDIDLLIPHQANIRIINSAMKNLDIPREKIYVNIEKTGNISSACIPVCLDELYSQGRIQSGMKICLVAFGAGLAYGSILFEA